MDVAFELRFLAIFFGVMLAAQVLFVVCWLAAKGVTRAFAVVRARRAPRGRPDARRLDAPR